MAMFYFFSLAFAKFLKKSDRFFENLVHSGSQRMSFFLRFQTILIRMLLGLYRGGPFDGTEKGPLDGTEMCCLDGTAVRFSANFFREISRFYFGKGLSRRYKCKFRKKIRYNEKNGLYHRTVPPVISGVSLSFVGFGSNSRTAIEFVKFWDWEWDSIF